MFHLVILPLHGILSLYVANGPYQGVARFRVTRDATAVDDRGIIARFLDLIYLFQLTAVYGLLFHLENHLIMILQGLNLFVHVFLSIVELLSRIILFSYTSI